MSRGEDAVVVVFGVTAVSDVRLVSQQLPSGALGRRGASAGKSDQSNETASLEKLRQVKNPADPLSSCRMRKPRNRYRPTSPPAGARFTRPRHPA